MTASKTLGRTGVSVSALGFGVSGPHASRALPVSQTIKLIQRAIELGITLFDTGPAYGNGEAEQRLGKAVAGADRDRLFVITKVGIPSQSTNGPVRDFTPSGIAASLDASLRRLKLDHVDGVLLHGPHADEITDELFAKLARLKASGKYRFLGLCGRGREVELALDNTAFDILMAPCHASIDQASRDRLKRANNAGLGVIGIEAMAAATGRWRLPKSSSDLWYMARAVKQTMTGQLIESQTSSPGDALEWALTRPYLDNVMSLTTRMSHLDANARAAGLDLAPSYS